jgi:hypothetical protein
MVGAFTSILTWRPTALSISLFVTMHLVRQSLATESPLQKFAITSSFGAVLLLFLIALWRKASEEIAELLALGRCLKSSHVAGTEMTQSRVS